MMTNDDRMTTAVVILGEEKSTGYGGNDDI
jgi:hypothetical protein